MVWSCTFYPWVGDFPESSARFIRGSNFPGPQVRLVHPGGALSMS